VTAPWPPGAYPRGVAPSPSTADALLRQARAAGDEGHYLRQLAAARQAAKHPGPQREEALLQALEALTFLARFDEADATAQALAAATPPVRLRAGLWRSYGATLHGRTDDARAHLDAAAQLLDDHGDPGDRFLEAITRSRLEQACDRPLRAIDEAERALQLAETLPVGLQCTAHYHTGHLWLDLNVFDRSASHFAAGLALAGLPDARVAALHIGASMAHRHLGDVVTARAHAEEAVARHAAGGRPYREGVARLALAEALQAGGDHGDALQEARAAIVRIGEGHSVVKEMEARLCLAKLLIGHQRPDTGRAELEAVLASPVEPLHGEARVLLAELASDLSDPHVRALQEPPGIEELPPSLQARAAWTLATLCTRVGAHDTAACWYARHGEARDAAGRSDTRRRYRVLEIREQVQAARQERERAAELADALRAQERLREAAEAAEAERRDLLELVAHDLRNPLSALLLMLDGVDEAEDHEEVQELVALGRRSAQAMRVVLDEALDTSGSIGELGQLEPVDLHAVVTEAVQAFAGGARAKGQQLSVVAEEAVVDGVAGLLRSVMDNLLSNALKFTPRGGTVTVRLEVHGDQVEISVVDDGPGLAAGEAERLFERRVRGSAQPTAGEPSTGLGLYLVRKVVDGHGGAVTASSDGPGQGSRFVVRLPGRRRA